MSSNLGLGLPKGLFTVGVLVKILKALLPYSLATWPTHLNLLAAMLVPTIPGLNLQSFPRAYDVKAYVVIRVITVELTALYCSVYVLQVPYLLTHIFILRYHHVNVREKIVAMT